MNQTAEPRTYHYDVTANDPRSPVCGQYVDVMHEAAYRHRWVIAWRDLTAKDPSRVGRFEPVRLASLDSYASGETLTDQQIAHRVRKLTAPRPPRN